MIKFIEVVLAVNHTDDTMNYDPNARRALISDMAKTATLGYWIKLYLENTGFVTGEIFLLSNLHGRRNHSIIYKVTFASRTSKEDVTCWA